MEPNELDWGLVTPELVSEEQGRAVHVINHFLESQDAIDRNVRFALARVLRFTFHLPPGWDQVVIFDGRGQNISDVARQHMRESLSDSAEVGFYSEGIEKWRSR